MSNLALILFLSRCVHAGARSTLIVCLEEGTQYSYLVQQAREYKDLIQACGEEPVATRCCDSGYLYGVKYRAGG